MCGKIQDIQNILTESFTLKMDAKKTDVCKEAKKKEEMDVTKRWMRRDVCEEANGCKDEEMDAKVQAKRPGTEENYVRT